MSQIAEKMTGPLFPLPPLPSHWHSLAHAFIHQAKARPQAPAISDSSGVNLTYHDTFVRAIALANLVNQDLGSAACVGILLPPSAAAALVNIALTILGRIPVNLNYTASKQTLNASMNQCGIEQVITSSKVIERLGLADNSFFLPVESLQERASLFIKSMALAEADLVPEKYLAKFLPGLADNFIGQLDHVPQSGLASVNKQANKLDDPAAIIFTAGSTAEPKGVILSHRNILSNLYALQLIAPAGALEVVLGVLPFFHSLGFTLTLWAVLALGLKTVYHYDPFDARLIGQLCQKHKVTAAFSTPTMMRNYLKRCPAEQFKSMRYCILGGEPLKEQLAAEIQKMLGIFPIAGYGLAETSPILTANLPQDVTLPDGRVVAGIRAGTVGLPLPGTEIKIINAETNACLEACSQGMIMAKGPQVMLGYLNNPQATSTAIKDGWFSTGDLGFLDDDGFLTITGRVSQFSKIAGEMVPHLAVEKEILKVAGASEDCVAVTAIPDQKRGERLVVIYCNLPMEPKEIVRILNDNQISRLWVPDTRDFIAVESLPVLPNGKLDRRKIQEIARLNEGSP